MDLTRDALPVELTQPEVALWWLAKGDFTVGPAWARAHEIAQASEGVAAFDRVHALLHWVEGDRGNSDYWYRRAGVARAGADPRAEWEAQVADLRR
ncbi:MAG: hypothetical protein QM699_18665 [Amaricoccus sp.]|uniref:hypothetical protein n=1 Tax=Amaricoccus sp. TaxID=1872485 RepID=UPI0039E69840